MITTALHTHIQTDTQTYVSILKLTQRDQTESFVHDVLVWALNNNASLTYKRLVHRDHWLIEKTVKTACIHNKID